MGSADAFVERRKVIRPRHPSLLPLSSEVRAALNHQSVRLSRPVGEGRGGGRVRERRAGAGAERGLVRLGLGLGLG